MARMIRSANHSSYPLGSDDPRDETTLAILVAEQSRAFVDIVTDGHVLPDRVAGYLAAAAVTPKPVKVTLPGTALADEVRELGAAGCRWFQVEAASAAVLDAAPQGASTILWAGRPEAAALAALPGTHVGLDLTEPAALESLAHLPPGRGVFLGLFDASREEVEDADDVAARLQPWRETLAGRDVIVGPNVGLAALPRDLAFEKLLQARYLAEGLRRRWSLSASRR